MYYFGVNNLLFSLQFMTIQKFLIPDGIEYYDNKQALLFENIRSSVLNIFKRYKYKLVITPIVDSVNNLTSLNDDKLKNCIISATNKNGLGIRSDITPQIARLDYQSYSNNKSYKYSYMGDIYRETSSLFDRNNPYQIGAEYFGDISDDVDIEILKMCIKIISLSKAKKIFLELSDASFVHKFINSLKISNNNKLILINLINLKSVEEIKFFFKQKRISNNKFQELSDLMSLDGPYNDSRKIKSFINKYNHYSSINIKSLSRISRDMKKINNIEVSIDLCSIKSVDYESTFNYCFYVENLRKAIATGGRYDAYTYDDNVIRNATGFSIDLKDIITIYEK